MTDPSSSAGDHGPGDLPGPLSSAAAAVFGDHLPLAVAYASFLSTEGVIRGLIGPREAPRIWERHLLNCGVLSEMIPSGASVVDVGSGAGLPGLVLAIVRPDLRVTLVEPLERRTTFLHEAVDRLGLAVTVFRGRAEAFDAASADVVTARAVAPLDRLAAWCLPLVAMGGRMLALKGSSAADEVITHGAAIAAMGGSEPAVGRCGVGVIDPPTTVVEIVRIRDVAVPPNSGGKARPLSGGGRPSSSSGRGGGRRR